MDSKVIKPFVEATKSVMKTMANTEVVVGDPHPKASATHAGVVSGVVGMVSGSSRGTLIVSFEEESLLEVVSNMFMEEMKEISDEVAEAVGELTNVIFGSAKPALAQLGLTFEMTQPIVVRGRDVELKPLGGAPSALIPFSTSRGKFFVEISFADAVEKRS